MRAVVKAMSVFLLSALADCEQQRCHDRSCASLRHPPSGIAPVHCTTLRFIGCCSGCCNVSGSHGDNHVVKPRPQGDMRQSVCKPMDDGNSETRCSSFCNPQFARVHCLSCACVECTFCSSATALHSALAARQPPPASPPTRLQTIQAWWRDGRPSGRWPDAGVLVRQLDEITVRNGLAAWEPCRADMWCSAFSNIWPSCVLNQRHNKWLYQGGEGSRRSEPAAGFVLAPPPLNRIRCAYPADGNTLGVVRDKYAGADSEDQRYGCKPPCNGPPFDTSERGAQACSFPPDALETALRLNAAGVDSRFKYAEVVVDALEMKAHLPDSILGEHRTGWNRCPVRSSSPHRLFWDPLADRTQLRRSSALIGPRAPLCRLAPEPLRCILHGSGDKERRGSGALCIPGRLPERERGRRAAAATELEHGLSCIMTGRRASPVSAHGQNGRRVMTNFWPGKTYTIVTLTNLY